MAFRIIFCAHCLLIFQESAPFLHVAPSEGGGKVQLILKDLFRPSRTRKLIIY